MSRPRGPPRAQQNDGRRIAHSHARRHHPASGFALGEPMECSTTPDRFPTAWSANSDEASTTATLGT